jgi:aspartate racemase
LQGNAKAESAALKTLGVIGGLGPESTLDYYQNIVALYRERKRDGNYPQFIINSINMKRAVDFLSANDLAGLADFLLDELGKLARSGADFGLIAANTPHIVFDQVASRSPVPLISIVESACAAAKVRGLKKVALFGTKYTMQADFYPKVFSREKIELVVPNEPDQAYLHDKYMNELVVGKFLSDTRAGLFKIVDGLRQDRQIDGVLLAGTELPLILRDESHGGIPLLNTGRIHCQAAVAEMLLN